MKFLSLINRIIWFQKTKTQLNKREIVQEINELGPYLARIGNPVYISKTEAYILRDDCLSDFKQVSIDKANRILRMIEKQAVELEKMQTLLTQVCRKFCSVHWFTPSAIFYIISMCFYIIIINNIYMQSVDLSKTEEEQILAKINEISFNVHVLETYLNRHRDVVPQRYRILVDRLQQNPHLQVLQKY